MKALAVPAEDRGSFDDEDPASPILPDGTEPSPQEPIRRHQFRALHRALENSDLMAQRENLKLQRRTTAKRGGK
jgi:hypothetical protein